MLWHPSSEKLERPVIQPRDQGEVFWNTALLSIEETNFLLLHEYEYKVSDITMNNIGTATLRHPQLLYASSRTTRGSGTSTGSGTTTTVVNSNPQGLWLERYPSLRTLEPHQNKQAIQARPANWHDTPGQYIECTCKLTATKAIKTNNSMAITDY